MSGNLRSLARRLRTTALEGHAVALVLETLGSDQTLDLGGLGVVLLALAGDGAADDELADIILLVETEETADLGGTLGAETLGDHGVGDTGDLTLTLLDDAQGENGKVETGDGCRTKLASTKTKFFPAQRGVPCFGLRKTYHHGHSCACALRCGGGGSSCGLRKGEDGYGWEGELEE